MTISGAAAPKPGSGSCLSGTGMGGSPADPPQPLVLRDQCWDTVLNPQRMGINLLSATASEDEGCYKTCPPNINLSNASDAAHTFQAFLRQFIIPEHCQAQQPRITHTPGMQFAVKSKSPGA